MRNTEHRREARQEASDFDRQTGIGELIGDLVEAPPRDKHAERMDERDVAATCHSRGHADHVRFCNASIEETIGKPVAEKIRFGRARQVGTQAHDPRIVDSRADQRLTIKTRDWSFAAGDEVAYGEVGLAAVGIRHKESSPSSTSASRAVSGGSFRLCDMMPSRPATPLPTSVLATIQVGRSRDSRATS